MAKILIVDDVEIILEALKESLQAEGHSVQSASNGVEAIKTVDQQVFDLVITDVMMPEKDGFALISHLMKTQPKLKVITISAFDYEEIAILPNVSKHFKKPFDLKSLSEAVKAALL